VPTWLQAAPDELDHGAILAAVAMLRSSPETELVFKHLSASIASVKQRCDYGLLSDAALDAVQAELCAEWFAAARALAQTSFFAGETRDALLSAVVQLSQTVESWCMEQLAEPLLARTIESVAAQCEALRPGLARHAGKSPADFGVKAKIRCNLSASVGCLALVHTAATPLEKLHCLRDTVQLTIKCVTRHLEDAGVELDDVELGSDDILDMLLYIICTAHEGADMSDLPGKRGAICATASGSPTLEALAHPTIISGHLEFAYRFHFVPRVDFESFAALDTTTRPFAKRSSSFNSQTPYRPVEDLFVPSPHCLSSGKGNLFVTSPVNVMLKLTYWLAAGSLSVLPVHA